jgi:hypothetical protein
MDTNNLIDIISLVIKVNIALESFLLLQYIIAFYLIRTGPVRNGVERGMSWMFGANIGYHLAIICGLVAANVFYPSGLTFEYVIVSSFIGLTRIFLCLTNAYLFHMLRQHTRLLDKAEIKEEPNDVYTY